MTTPSTHNPHGTYGARLRRCATCKQSKPLTEYSHRSHRRCGACMSLILEVQERRHITAADRRRAARLPARISNSSSQAVYTGAELRAHVRPGALDALALPSRMGRRLHYRDGRVEVLE